MKKIKLAAGRFIFAQNVKEMRVFENTKQGADKQTWKICFTMIGTKEDEQQVFSDPFDSFKAAEDFLEAL